MRQKTHIILFIVTVFLIISTPLALYVLGIKVQPKGKKERKISLNFKRNFPLKEDLFKLFINLKSEVLDVNAIPNKIIDPRNGWKFLGNNFSNALSESKGLIVFTKEELQILKTNLLSQKDFLEKKGIAFYITIAPNKHTVYDSLIPIKKSLRNTKLQQLDSLCTITNINFINLGMNFPNPKDQKLYHQTDTHWNGYAGFYAYETSILHIAKEFKEYSFLPFSLTDMKEEIRAEVIGDINRMVKNDYIETLTSLKPKLGLKSVKKENTLTIPSHYGFSHKLYEKRYQNLGSNDLKLLAFKDSFFAYYGTFLSEHFKESVFISSHKFDKPLIELEKPDILYYEIVERNIDVLLEN